MLRICSVLLMTLILSACISVPDKVWQPICNKGQSYINPPKLEAYTCAATGKGRSIACSLKKDDRDAPNSLRVAYLEYPEKSLDGTAPESRDACQLQAILDTIKKQKESSGRPLLVSVYVHGWHHDASPDSENRKKYPNMLARYYDSLKKINKNDEDNYDVLGIYVGWRGESNKLPLLNSLTIGGRAKVADKVGKDSQLKAELNKIADTMRVDDRNRMIVMGHSLGGRVLSRAFMSDLKQGTVQPLGERVVITTVNPAIGAEAYLPLYVSNNVSTESRVPTWVNFTSEDDWATKNTYKFAGSVGLLRSHADDSKLCTKQAVGHYQDYITHRVSVHSCGEENCEPMPEAYPGYWQVKGYSFFALHYDGLDHNKERLYPPVNQCVLMVEEPWTPGRGGDIQMETKGVCGDFAKHIYTVDKEAVKKIPMNGRLWNIFADKSVFDFSESSFWKVSTHNGYVQTDLTAMLVQLVFELELEGALK